MPTTNPIEAPRPEAPPYTWPNQDLKNLVQLAPMSPYTRALLRIKFNRPLPDGCTTFEQIESWLATLPPVRFSSPPAYSPRPPAPSRNVEIQRGEFITVEARIYGSETQYVGWSKEGGVDVPLSVWQDGAEAVRDYVEAELEDYDPDYGDTDYGDWNTDGLELESDMEELMERADRMIRERDGDSDE